jgi:uncharacterized RmlC-like cupin family protein
VRTAPKASNETLAPIQSLSIQIEDDAMKKRIFCIMLAGMAIMFFYGFGGYGRPGEGPGLASMAVATTKKSLEIVTVRPSTETMSRQQLPYFVGISEATAGAKGISMNLVVIPPGASAKPHIHRGYESAIYLLEGHVETRYGPGLRKSVINKAGDFIFIPADVPHQPINLSATQPARAIVARNDPNEQEHVFPYNPKEELQPSSPRK